MSLPAVHLKGIWSMAQVSDFLEDCVIPLRLSVNSRSGYPVLCTLWYLFKDQRLWCATSQKAKVCGLIRKDGRCAFEVSPDQPPYRGVRGLAVASLHPDRGEEILSALIDRYLEDRNSKLANWLLKRVDQEVAISLELQSIFCWDYTSRMTQ